LPVSCGSDRGHDEGAGGSCSGGRLDKDGPAGSGGAGPSSEAMRRRRSGARIRARPRAAWCSGRKRWFWPMFPIRALASRGRPPGGRFRGGGGGPGWPAREDFQGRAESTAGATGRRRGLRARRMCSRENQSRRQPRDPSLLEGQAMRPPDARRWEPRRWIRGHLRRFMPCLDLGSRDFLPRQKGFPRCGAAGLAGVGGAGRAAGAKGAGWGPWL